MAGHLDLGLAQNLLQVTHAQRPPEQQMDDPQPGSVAQALMDAEHMHFRVYMCLHIFLQAQIHSGGAAAVGHKLRIGSGSDPAAFPHPADRESTAPPQQAVP